MPRTGGPGTAPEPGRTSDAGWLDNLHPALRRCWHPVGREEELACGGDVALMGDTWTVDAAVGACRSAVGPWGTAAAVTTHLGLVWVAPEVPLAPLPVVPEDGDPAFVAVPAPPWDWAASAGQMADGACDISHVPFLHRGTIGNPEETDVAPYEVEIDPDRWTATASYSHTSRALDGRSGPDGAPRMVPRRVTIAYTVPFCVRLRLEHPEEDVVLTSVFLHQPGWPGRTRLWCINYRTDIADGRCSPEEATALHRRVNNEDRVMLERYPCKALPLDLRREVHVRSDRITVELRRGLRRLVVGAAAEGGPSTVGGPPR